MNINAVRFSDQPLQGVNVVIEVQVDAEPNEYGMDKRSGVSFIDRYLYLPMRDPGTYGFAPRTLFDDGDPIDVLVAL